MIKKIIFPLAITLSLTTHHAVCMEEGDDKLLDRSTILAKLAALNEERKKESEKNAELTKNYRYFDRGFLLSPSLMQSYHRIYELYAQKQQLEALLEKEEEQAPTS